MQDRIAASECTTAVQRIEDTEQLERMMSEPSERLIRVMERLEGDVIVLGVGGKMGPGLAWMAKRASDAAERPRRVIGVSRFSNEKQRERLESVGVETVRCDLLDPDQVRKLPDAANVVFMAGQKFGTTSREAMTWATNCYLPGLVGERYRESRIVAFSTGNVYGLSPVSLGGSVETDPVDATGEYAISTLGRERIFEYFGRTFGTPVSLIRLYYAIDMRYGVLFDIASRVYAGESIDLGMGTCNCIWQGDANAMSLCAFEHASSPPFVLNVCGPELLSMRRIAEQFGRLMNREPVFTGSECPDSLIGNGQLGHRLYGYPRVSVQQLINWVADWIMRGGESLGKPTHFESRDGKY